MFDTIIAVDWSARSTPSPVRPTKDAIYLCVSRLHEGASQHPEYFRTRAEAMVRIHDLLDGEMAAGRRSFIGFDFNFGYPSGFAKILTGRTDGISVWKWMSERIEDRLDNQNNRFDVAAEINAQFPGIGPFWGAPNSVCLNGLPHKGSLRHGHGMNEWRQSDLASKTAQSSWKLYTTGSVGSQAILGMSHLYKLKGWLGRRGAVFPLETGSMLPHLPVVIGEIYPSYYRVDYMIPLEEKYPNAPYHILDARQVRQVCDRFACLMQTEMHAAHLFDITIVKESVLKEEGWIVGVPANGMKT